MREYLDDGEELVQQARLKIWEDQGPSKLIVFFVRLSSMMREAIVGSGGRGEQSSVKSQAEAELA